MNKNTIIYEIKSRGERKTLDLLSEEPIYPPYEDSELLAQTIWQASFYSKAIDIGTGSGVQSIVYSLKHPKTEILSIDILRKTLNYAVKNAENNNVANNCEFVRTTKLACFKENKQPTIWICNPPYLPKNEQIDPHMPKEELITLVSGKSGFEFSLEIINLFEDKSNQEDVFYLLTSSHSCPETFEKLLAERGLDTETLAENHLFFETLKVQKIKKSDRNETD